MASSPVTSWQIKWENSGSSVRFYLLGLQNHCGWWLQPWNQRTIASWQESDDKPRQCVEKQRHNPANKGLYSQGCGLPSGHVWLWELDLKEGRTPKNWCLQTVVLQKTLESPLDIKEIKSVNFKGNQPWILTGRTDAEVETQVFCSSDVNSWLIRKVPDAGKDWGQKEKRASENEMAGWYHWCDGHGLGQTSGDGEGQAGLAGCSPWGCKESDTTGRLNNNNNEINTEIITTNSHWDFTVLCPNSYSANTSHCYVAQSMYSVGSSWKKKKRSEQADKWTSNRINQWVQLHWVGYPDLSSSSQSSTEKRFLWSWVESFLLYRW